MQKGKLNHQWSGGFPKCKECGKELKNRYAQFCPHCVQIGERNPVWKGGKVNRNGYVAILKPEHPNANPSGYVFEHRLAMEKKIGRYLHKLEVVHHINEIKTDNRIENLMLLKNNGQHTLLYNLKK